MCALHLKLRRRRSGDHRLRAIHPARGQRNALLPCRSPKDQPGAPLRSTRPNPRSRLAQTTRRSAPRGCREMCSPEQGWLRNRIRPGWPAPPTRRRAFGLRAPRAVSARKRRPPFDASSNSNIPFHKLPLTGPWKKSSRDSSGLIHGLLVAWFESPLRHSHIVSLLIVN